MCCTRTIGCLADAKREKVFGPLGAASSRTFVDPQPALVGAAINGCGQQMGEVPARRTGVSGPLSRQALTGRTEGCDLKLLTRPVETGTRRSGRRVTGTRNWAARLGNRLTVGGGNCGWGRHQVVSLPPKGWRLGPGRTPRLRSLRKRPSMEDKGDPWDNFLSPLISSETGDNSNTKASALKGEPDVIGAPAWPAHQHAFGRAP